MEKHSRTKIKNKRFLLVLTLIVSTCFVGTVASQTPEQPTIYVSPSTYIATHIGERVNITVNIKNVTEDMQLIGVDWKLKFNTTILEVLNVTEGGFFKNWAETAGLDPDDIFFWWLAEDDYAISFTIYLDFAATPPTVFPEGNGTLATITFNATYRPTEAEPEASCVLEITNTILLDVDGVEIPYESENGYYEATPLSFPTLSVKPYPYVATHEGEVFVVNVNIEELDRDWRLIGVDFKLKFNTTLLDVLNVTEGDFLKDFARRAGTNTWLQVYVEEEHGRIGILILPISNGTWPSNVFPEGEGTLATITFNSTYKPPETEPVFCSLELADVILLDVSGEEIDHYLKHGYYTMVETKISRLYTIDVSADAGPIHFRGEIADLYIFISKLGQPTDATEIIVALYNNGSLIEDLSTKIEHIETGVYRISYPIPVNAPSGTYALIIKARYQTLQGNALKTFLLSEWIEGILKEIKGEIATVIVPSLGEIKTNLTAINAKIVDIDGKLVTIQTSIGLINANLTAINAKLVSLEETVAVINTDLGILKTDVKNINLKVINVTENIATIQTSLGTIQGEITAIGGDTANIATIKTDLGTVKADVSEVKGTTSDITGNMGTLITLMYVAIVLALIAAIGAILSLLQMQKK